MDTPMDEQNPSDDPKTLHHCAYCGEPATAVVEPEDSDERIFVCADHEERAIVESGSGHIEQLGAAQ